MSVAQDDSGHHRAYDPSTNPSRIPQEYGNNNAISSILNKDVEGDSRRSTPLPNSSNQNSNKPIVESTPSDNGLSQSHPHPNSSTISTASQSNQPSVNDPSKMRAAPPHDMDATRVPSPAVAAAAIAASSTGSGSPPHSKSLETTRGIKDGSPIPTASNSSSVTAALDESPTPQPTSKTRPTLKAALAPASPPPSPPSAAGNGTTAVNIDSPMGLLSTAPQSTTPTPIKGGSLASLLHSAHREVDVPESAGGGGTERREPHGTPLSPTSMSQSTHSRKDSAATMASASTGIDSPLKGPREGAGAGEPMDLDQPPPPRSGEGAASAVGTPTGLGGKAPMGMALPYPPSRSSPLPRPHSATPMSAGVGYHRSQPSPSPATPTPSHATTTTTNNAGAHTPKSAYPHAAGTGAAAMHAGTTPTSASHQRRHSLSRTQHSHTRSHSGRLIGGASSAAAAAAAAAGGPSSAAGVSSQQPPSLPQQAHPHSVPQPRPLSPASRIPGFKQSDHSSTMMMTESSNNDRDGEYTRMRTTEYEDLRSKFDRLMAQNRELLREREHNARQVSQLEADVRAADKTRLVLARRLEDWIRTGENLLRGFIEPIMEPTFNGHAHELAERDHDRASARRSAGPGTPLSSAMVGGSREHYDRLARDKTLSVVMPSSAYPSSASHGRPSSAYGHESYPMHHTGTPTQPESALYHPRSAGQTQRPTHNSSNSQSLRRSRRPSSDELAEIHGGKRIKANNGTFIRTSPDASERAGHTSHSGPASASSLGHPLGRIGGAGEFTSYPTSNHRATGSLGNVPEHGRDSPLNRRLMAARDEEEDEFPSPRRSFVAPTNAQGNHGNGYASAPVSARPGQARDPRVTALLAGDDADAIGSPDNDTTVHESLMEMVDEEDPEHSRPMHALRHVRGSVMRNGSRSSINSQDIDDMLAEVVDDETSRLGGNGALRSAAKQRYRNSNPGAATGGVTSSFPIHLGTQSEALSPGHARSYTPSSQTASSKFMSSVSPAPHPANSRGYVFRNTDVADMEAQAQARSPEELGHRPSLSGSGSFNGANTSPPGNNSNAVTTQFLPPQSGPPQPKKIYHSKGTGQVIGSQHASMMNPVPPVPVEAAPQLSRPVAPTSSFTADGLPKRTCKQCGQPGRYKDSKCVEKWGPGPQGPGTVCDRCRKKMKRVEKRATQDSAAMTAAMNNHQYPIAPAPSGSFTNQGSQRQEEPQEYGYSQGADEQSSLSRSASHTHSTMHPQGHLNRRESRGPDMQRDATLPYPPPSSTRETMPPPTSFSGAYGSPRSSRSKPREPSADTRDGDLDADGDAEMDELVDDEFAAAADAAVAQANRRRDHPIKPEA